MVHLTASRLSNVRQKTRHYGGTKGVYRLPLAGMVSVFPRARWLNLTASGDAFIAAFSPMSEHAISAICSPSWELFIR